MNSLADMTGDLTGDITGDIADDQTFAVVYGLTSKPDDL